MLSATAAKAQPLLVAFSCMQHKARTSLISRLNTHLLGTHPHHTSSGLHKECKRTGPQQPIGQYWHHFLPTIKDQAIEACRCTPYGALPQLCNNGGLWMQAVCSCTACAFKHRLPCSKNTSRVKPRNQHHVPRQQLHELLEACWKSTCLTTQLQTQANGHPMG